MAQPQITKSSDFGDSTYFTRGDVEPTLTGDVLTIYEGKGRHRGWGAPQVWSSIIVAEDDFIAIHIGFNTKHGGGQFYRYYQPTVAGTWGRFEWRALPDAVRARVLDAYPTKAPHWAKSPGKLSAEKQAPKLTTQVAYKVVRVLSGGRMVSLFDGETEYEIGRRLAQKAEDGHSGGYYSYKSARECKHLFETGELVPERCYEEGMGVALLEVEISGTIVRYGGEPIFATEESYFDMEPTGYSPTKLASTYLRPVRIVETFTYTSKQLQEVR